MPIPPTILLSLLASGVRAIKGALAPAQTPDPQTDFSSLLDRARAGEVTTGLPVRVAPGASLQLTDAQLDRLALAADRAESAGATRALAFIDGRALEIDIPTRTVTREHAVEHARAITGIDAFIDAGITTPQPAPGVERTAEALHPTAPLSSLNLAPRGVAPAPLPPPNDPSRWSASLLSALAER